MANQNSAPRNTPDAVADEAGWRHPQTGELLVSVKGLKVGPKLKLVVTPLSGAAPLEVKAHLEGGDNIVGGSIQWGDGSPDVTIHISDAASHTHTYHNVGECTLKATATFQDGTTEFASAIVKIKKAPVASTKKTA